jgi:hypothetical protein
VHGRTAPPLNQSEAAEGSFLDLRLPNTFPPTRLLWINRLAEYKLRRPKLRLTRQPLLSSVLLFDWWSALRAGYTSANESGVLLFLLATRELTRHWTRMHPYHASPRRPGALSANKSWADFIIDIPGLICDRGSPLSRPQISGPSGFLAVIAILIVHK